MTEPTTPSPTPVTETITQEIFRIPVRSIDPGTRLRTDYGDIPSMMASFIERGQMTPIEIDQNNRLVFGGRRYYTSVALLELKADQELKTGKPYIIKFRGEPWDECLRCQRVHLDSEFDLRLREIEENVKRKDFTWQELCMATYEVHNMKSRESHRQGKQWTKEKTGLVLGISAARVVQVLPVATVMAKDPNSPLWQCTCFDEAMRKILDLCAERAKLVLAKHIQATPQVLAAAHRVIDSLQSTDKPSLSYAKLKVLEGAAPTEAEIAAGKEPVKTITEVTEELQSTRKELSEQVATIELNTKVLFGSCLNHMGLLPVGLVKHIITDPPYCINMKMLDQTNTGIDVSQTVNEHDVKQNNTLIEAFIPEAFRVLDPKGFLIMCCDDMNFGWLAYLGAKAGFAVQQWPGYWCKPQAQNQAPAYNFTKAVEPFIVMRKKGAILAKHQPLNWKCISKSVEDKRFDHPFVKPLELWTWLIEAVSQPQDLIYDPFAGSFSGSCAAIKLDRDFLASECAEQHFYTGLTNVTKSLVDRFKQLKIEPHITYTPLPSTSNAQR